MSSVGGMGQLLGGKFLSFWPERDGLGRLVARSVGTGWFREVVEAFLAPARPIDSGNVTASAPPFRAASRPVQL